MNKLTFVMIIFFNPIFAQEPQPEANDSSSFNYRLQPKESPENGAKSIPPSEQIILDQHPELRAVFEKTSEKKAESVAVDNVKLAELEILEQEFKDE